MLSSWRGYTVIRRQYDLVPLPDELNRRPRKCPQTEECSSNNGEKSFAVALVHPAIQQQGEILALLGTPTSNLPHRDKTMRLACLPCKMAE